MSVMEDILINIRDTIKKNEFLDTFRDIEVYYDDAEMNPNTPLPAISFKVGECERVGGSIDCMEYTREIEIRLHTITLNPRQLQSELYDFEEALLKIIELHKEKVGFEWGDIRQTKISGIGALVYQKNKGAGYEKENLFSNIIRVYFDIDYQIF